MSLQFDIARFNLGNRVVAFPVRLAGIVGQ